MSIVEQQANSQASMLCRLCRRSQATLTNEHVPPKSTGNRGAVELEYLTFDGGLKVVHTAAPDGVALRVLCGDCNSRFGSRLGTGFGDFVKQVSSSGRFEAPGGGAFVSAIDVYPGRVVRQLLLSFICVQPFDDEGRYDATRSFIRSRDNQIPDVAPRVALYFNMSQTYRIVPVCGVGALDSRGKNWSGAEICAPGLGVLFSFTDPEDLAWLSGVRPLDITDWAARSFEARETVALRLPRLSVEHPHPLGFGSRSEVDRWQSKRKIIWLVSGADNPRAVNSTTALWRRKRRRRGGTRR